MGDVDTSRARRQTSVPAMIAWLSVCLLAAAWGGTLDARWQSIWAQAGTFGLVSAVGLGAIEKSRTTYHQRSRDSQLRARLDHGLSKLHEHSATVDSVNSALRRLADFVVRHPQLLKRPRGQSRSYSEILANFPVAITPLPDPAREEFEAAESAPAISLTGAIRQISTRGVSFEHDVAFEAPMAVLTFELDKQRQLSFVVEVLWTKPSETGLISGGTLLAVGVPAHADAGAYATV